MPLQKSLKSNKKPPKKRRLEEHIRARLANLAGKDLKKITEVSFVLCLAAF